MTAEAIIHGGIWGKRVHLFRNDALDSAVCGGPGFCRDCNREMGESYVSDQTKKRIRGVLEEHLGPSVANDITDQQDLRKVEPEIEWGVVAAGLEAEFDLHIDTTVLRGCQTIDMIARFIDLLISSKHARPN